MSRLPMLDAAAVPPEAQSDEEKAAAPLNRTRTLAAIDGWPTALNDGVSSLWRHGALEPALCATAIIVVSRRSPYEMAVNVPKALAAGLSDDMIEAIEDEDWTDPSFSDAQKAVFRFAMMFDAGHGIPDADFARLQDHLDESQILQLAGICTHYGGLARLAIALAYDAEG